MFMGMDQNFLDRIRLTIFKIFRVKLGKFGHQVNSDTHLHNSVVSSGILWHAYLIYYLFQYLKYETNKVAV